MKNCIFLIIILGFIRISFCCSVHVNSSEDVCAVKWFRRKRAIGDYTRWKSNIETTPEFIVKVLDDDIASGTTNQLVAENVLPVTKRGEKIIVGGVMGPTLLTPSADVPHEYTRFKPPNVAGATVPEITSTREALLSMPSDQRRKGLPLSLLPRPSVRNPNRDESPPAEPQFLPRAPGLQAGSAQQYAPIAPVAFTRRPTNTPLQPTYDQYIQRPTRLSLPAVPVPSRTPGLLDKLENIEDFPIMDALLDDDIENQLTLTRTTLKDWPSRTTNALMKTDIFDNDFEHFHTTAIIEIGQITTQTLEHGSGSEIDEHSASRDKDEEKDNYIFYNDYNDNSKKEESLGRIEYEDKLKPEHPFEKKPQVLNKTTHAKNLSLEEAKSVQAGDNNIVDAQYNDEPFTNISTDDYKIQSAKLPDVSVSRKSGPVCNMIKLRSLNFNTPQTLPEIVDQLKRWTDESPLARWTDITGGNLTTMENPIYIVTVDDPSVGQVASEKHNVLLIAGIQGHDHRSVTAAMYILYQLIERSDTHYELLSKYRFWVIPVFNPDGYDYSITFPQRRSWKKNLRQTWDECKGRKSCSQCSSYGIRCIISPCYGVNLDRNFEYQWIPPNELQSEHPCGDLYAGTRQMSEVETQALTNYIHTQHLIFSVFIALKEGHLMGVLYPYSHTKKRRAFDQIYRYRASRAAAAAHSIGSRTYVAGQTSEYLPLYAGGIEDWADSHLVIENTYTVMMLRPRDEKANSEYINNIIHEAYAAMDSLLMSCLTSPPHSPILTLTKSMAFYTQPSLTSALLASISNILFSHNLTYKNAVT